MNLRNEFDRILEKYGYPVLVVRQSKKLRCSCWNEKTQEADRKCPRCFGLGWNPLVEKHLARAEELAGQETIARSIVTGGYGQISATNRTYYMKVSANLAPKDLIVDVDWTDSGKPVYKGAGIYEISHVDETLRYEKGEQIYKKVSCKDNPVQKNIRGIRIAEVSGIINYELAMEDM